MHLKLLILLAFSCLFERSATKNIGPKSTKWKLVIDHDGGADDAMAVMMCLLYEKYFNGMEVVGLTTTHGNVNETQVYINSQRFLDLAGRRDVPINRGATEAILIPVESDFYFGHDGLGDNDNNSSFEPIQAKELHAANALIEFSKTYEGELVVMAIGPVTNIALAQRLDPKFIGRLKQLYVGAGHIPSEKHPDAEFNAEMDVEAYHIVAGGATPDKVTFVPFSQIVDSLNLTREWRVHVLGAINTPIIKALNNYERISLAASEHWHLLDPVVAAIVLEQYNVVKEFKEANHGIHVCGTNRGININSLGLEGANMRLVYSFLQDAYVTLLLDIFSADTNMPEPNRPLFTGPYEISYRQIPIYYCPHVTARSIFLTPHLIIFLLSYLFTDQFHYILLLIFV